MDDTPLSSSDGRQESRETGSALSKAVAVMHALLSADRPQTLADLSTATDMPRQTVHRILGQLEEEALVRRLPDREGFMIGPRMVGLGIEALGAAARTSPIRAVLYNLVQEVGETCNLGVLDRDRVVYIERVECAWPLRLQLGVGSRVPTHATAIGKLLLAHLPSRTRKRILNAGKLERFTEYTLTDPEKLEQQFARIRRQGFAANDQENTLGLIGFAVPIRDDKNRVIAGVSVHAPEARMSVDKAESQLENFRRAARQLEEEFRHLKQLPG